MLTAAALLLAVLAGTATFAILGTTMVRAAGEAADEFTNSTGATAFTIAVLIIGAWVALAAGVAVGIVVYGWAI